MIGPYCDNAQRHLHHIWWQCSRHLHHIWWQCSEAFASHMVTMLSGIASHMVTLLGSTLSHIVIMLRANQQSITYGDHAQSQSAVMSLLLITNQIWFYIWWLPKTMWPQSPIKMHFLAVLAHNLCDQHWVHIIQAKMEDNIECVLQKSVPMSILIYGDYHICDCTREWYHIIGGHKIWYQSRVYSYMVIAI